MVAVDHDLSFFYPKVFLSDPSNKSKNILNFKLRFKLTILLIFTVIPWILAIKATQRQGTPTKGEEGNKDKIIRNLCSPFFSSLCHIEWKYITTIVFERLKDFTFMPIASITDVESVKSQSVGTWKIWQIANSL